MSTSAPCKDCSNRTPTCHSTCGAYKSWASEQSEAKRKSTDAYYARQYIPDNIKKYSWESWKKAARRGRGKTN